MGREIDRLSAMKVKSRKLQPGLHADGGGLYLQVTPGAGRSWIFRYTHDGQRRDMGLGSARTITLAEARAAAAECRRSRLQGIDPLARRTAERTAERIALAKAMTFRQCAEAYIETNEAGWRNAKHAAQWRATLATYAYPAIGNLSVAAIDTGLVLKVIEPIWATKTETAGRVRGRIEAVLDFATAREHRQGDNPARWKGHIALVLPEAAKVNRVEHHAALPYVEIGAFVAALRQQQGTAARALELLILTAGRTGEVLGARHSEIAAKIWTVPADRMKGRRDHQVPLAPAALAIVADAKALRGDGFLFPGAKRGRPLSNMAMLQLLRRMKRPDLTVHGFRSSFRDWAAERTNFPREAAEMALAHAVGDKVEAAYRRGDLFDKRRRLMEAWAEFCSTAKPAGEVVAIGRTMR